MSQGNNSPGISKLAGVVGKLTELARDDSLILDFGVINADGSLTTNTFPLAIQPHDYLVCRCAALPPTEVVSTNGHGHSCQAGGDPSHTHGIGTRRDSVDIARGSQRRIQPGDRVLVAWVQNDAVVIDIIVHANEFL